MEERKKRVLAIDDEEQLLYLYRRILFRYNHEVVTAINGEDGVKLFKEEKEQNKKIDVILMDFRMEIMNGIKATKQILAIDKEAKIIFLSADITVEEQALKAGAKSFLIKPFKFEKVIKEIVRVTKE